MGLRALAVGRKNYMLPGNEGGGKTAPYYSLIGSCRACDVNPFEYFKMSSLKSILIPTLY